MENPWGQALVFPNSLGSGLRSFRQTEGLTLTFGGQALVFLHSLGSGLCFFGKAEGLTPAEHAGRAVK